MCEIQQDPAAAVIDEETVQFLADLMDQGRLEHQSGLHEIDHRNTIDILHLQMLESPIAALDSTGRWLHPTAEAESRDSDSRP